MIGSLGKYVIQYIIAKHLSQSLRLLYTSNIVIIYNIGNKLHEQQGIATMSITPL